MIHFECDYTEGAHPAIMQRLCETNMEQTAGYGNDPYCEHAAELIRKLCNAPAAGVHFLVGGTQANKTVIAATLRPPTADILPYTKREQSNRPDTKC